MIQNRGQFFFLIITPPILLFACALAMIWIPLPRPFPAALSRGRNQIAAIVTGILGLVYVVGVTVYTLGALRQPCHLVDNAFVPLELTARNYMLFGRQYHGLVRGRQVEARFIPPGRYHADLKIYIRGSLSTRMAIGQKKPLVHCKGCSRLTPRAPDLSSLQVFALDVAWADRLLTAPDAQTELRRLLVAPGAVELPELYIQPDRIWFSVHPQQITVSRIRQWTEDLLTLAQVAESLP